ncbi:hypothetical protein CAOG_07318 [Capsaspora owczarzaki ATCC 30864]|uniref:Uncharacterized protein n=1 Tax=Capsaspora owczarzaki (strain ATCC 30864) TaxID=595528 RepID=A0A0D2WXH3_CAPO3|nr:hypothetical protein CAOG_07318 [Capsaspora owczarzaki ATCC 30864]KJE97463.1 hypothetical protein CAOG_007318 [Capsaspora owczarzaki ATCC 30864]|eukprot:XP_004343177.1 hypothetical protein CAOG_07318 [Capsaspora owczarzaki ATCC 30864]
MNSGGHEGYGRHEDYDDDEYDGVGRYSDRYYDDGSDYDEGDEFYEDRDEDENDSQDSFDGNDSDSSLAEVVIAYGSRDYGAAVLELCHARLGVAVSRAQACVDWLKNVAGWAIAPVLEWLPELRARRSGNSETPTFYFSNWLYQFELGGFRTSPKFADLRKVWRHPPGAHPFVLAATRRLVVGCLLAWGYSPSKCISFMASLDLGWSSFKHPYDRALKNEWRRLHDRVEEANQDALDRILLMAKRARPLKLSALCRLKLWRHAGSEAAVAKALGVSNIDALLGLVPPVPQPGMRVPAPIARFVLDMPLARHLQRVPAYHDLI